MQRLNSCKVFTTNLSNSSSFRLRHSKLQFNKATVPSERIIPKCFVLFIVTQMIIKVNNSITNDTLIIHHLKCFFLISIFKDFGIYNVHTFFLASVYIRLDIFCLGLLLQFYSLQLCYKFHGHFIAIYMIPCNTGALPSYFSYSPQRHRLTPGLCQGQNPGLSGRSWTHRSATRATPAITVASCSITGTDGDDLSLKTGSDP